MYPEGSLGADLSAALKGKKEQADLLEQIKTESAKAGGSGGSDGATGADDKRSNTPGEPTEQPSKQPPPPPPAPKPEIGELSCKVCMRAVDNIYADVNALAKEYAEQHGGATPGPEDGEDLVQRGLEQACAGVKPKKVLRACKKVLLWEITSYVEELFSAYCTVFPAVVLRRPYCTVLCMAMTTWQQHLLTCWKLCCPSGHIALLCSALLCSVAVLLLLGVCTCCLRICNDMGCTRIVSCMMRSIEAGLGPFRTTLDDICVKRTRLCTKEDIPPAPSTDTDANQGAEGPGSADGPPAGAITEKTEL